MQQPFYAPQCLMDRFHCSDSGTKRLINKVRKAGAAPTSITQRQEWRVMEKKAPMTAISA